MKPQEIIEDILKIRFELFKDNTDWFIVCSLSKKHKLNDTAYREKLLARNKQGLLNDYLLNIDYYMEKYK